MREHSKKQTPPGGGGSFDQFLGCLQLQVIFCKRATNFRALLREMTYKIRHLVTLRHPVCTVSKYLALLCWLYCDRNNDGSVVLIDYVVYRDSEVWDVCVL